MRDIAMVVIGVVESMPGWVTMEVRVCLVTLVTRHAEAP